MMRNVPKLKELNYTQWKNVIANSIKKSNLWGYIDGSIEEPTDHNAGHLATYYDEAGAVRNAILGSLEPGAQRYIEEALDPRDAWVALEKKYLTAEAETDAELVDIEKRLSDMRLEEDGDMIEHIAEFCRMRCRLNGTRFALDDQACISMLYRSLPPIYRQSVLTPERTEMKDFGALCARLSDLNQNPEPRDQTTADDAPEDYTSWGVPKDIKAFELTGDKNPLLAARAAVTCRDCLLKDHKAGTPECPQYEWRKELWGTHKEPSKNSLEIDNPGRNILAQAPPGSGKTTALALSAIQMTDSLLPHIQVLVVAPTDQATTAFQTTSTRLAPDLKILRYSLDAFPTRGKFNELGKINSYHVVVGTPDHLLEITRRLLHTRNIKLLVLDDIDKIIDTGFEEQILEIYRQLPPVVQVVASSTILSSSSLKIVPKILDDPLRITVDRDEGVYMSAPHFFAKIPTKSKLDAMQASFSILGYLRTLVLCRSDTQISSYGANFSYAYDLRTADSSQHGYMVNCFKNYSSSVMVIDEEFLSTGLMTETHNLGAHLLIFDIPRNDEEYAKLIIRWRKNNPSGIILTLVTTDTDEILVIEGFKQYYGAHVAELPHAMMYGARLSRWAGRRATRKLVKQIRLVNILSGDACSPLGLEEFEAYVALQEHSLENLQFIIWYHDYQRRFFALKNEEQALSPPPAKSLGHLALPTPIATYGNSKAPIPDSPRSSGWALSPTSSFSATSWSSWSPISVPSPMPSPLKDQPFRNETLQIVATFIRPGAKKELNLDMDVRDELLRELEKSTHPDVFAPAYAQIYDLVDGCSVPNFVSYAAANINLPKQMYWYAIGIIFTLISWVIAIFTIYFVPDHPRSKRSIRLVSVPFAVLGCMQIYSAWRGFCSQVFGRSARQLHTWELVDPADAGVSFQITGLVPSLPPKPPPLRTVLEMVAGTKKHDVAPFANLPSRSSLEMVDMAATTSSLPLSGPRVVFTDPEPQSRGGRAAFRRPAVYGPERVVEDPRIREFHQGVIRDMLWVGFGWGLAWTGIVVGIPGRG
ncbi:unnamed protein product [Rhizoctonia solani]|uniref:Helicase ATP-binding domain-containing protein n=1 Tax=Rhizoctonia solani TaxID=456999 RepID=A0A8H3B015_9AGAM|nr:unnamed protein product [Rhizoctonia solani]